VEKRLQFDISISIMQASPYTTMQKGAFRMLQKLKQRKESGFTIIEVMIVLAIAGLIMVVVFLAVPNLQKSQRNNARKTDANNALSAFSTYVSNNGGNNPAACSNLTDCTGSFLNGVNMGYFKTDANVKYVTSAPATAPNSEQLFIVSGADCSGGVAAKPVSGSTVSARSVVAYYGIEGSVPTQCIQG
jgi:prepilin-type N-terminal cleavage/methylation domain-containing protein